MSTNTVEKYKLNQRNTSLAGTVWKCAETVSGGCGEGPLLVKPTCSARIRGPAPGSMVSWAPFHVCPRSVPLRHSFYSQDRISAQMCHQTKPNQPLSSPVPCLRAVQAPTDRTHMRSMFHPHAPGPDPAGLCPDKAWLPQCPAGQHGCHSPVPGSLPLLAPPSPYRCSVNRPGFTSPQ